MRVIDVKTHPNGKQEFTIDLTKYERELIKKAKGWKRLTNKRLQSWYLETLANTNNHEYYSQLLTSLVYRTLFFSTKPMDVEDVEKAIIKSGEFPFDDENSPIDLKNIKTKIERSSKQLLDDNPYIREIADNEYILIPTYSILREWFLFDKDVPLSKMHEYPTEIPEIQGGIQSVDQIDEFLDDNIPYKRLLAAVMAKKKFKQYNEPLLNDLFKNDPDQLVRYGSFIQLLNDKKMSKEKIELIEEGLSDTNTKLKLASFDFLAGAMLKSLPKDMTNQLIDLLAEYLDDDLLEYNALDILLRRGHRTEMIPYLLKYLENNFLELDNDQIKEIKEKIFSLLPESSRIPIDVGDEIKGYCESENPSIQNLALKIMNKRWRKSEYKELTEIKTGSPHAEIKKLRALGDRGTEDDLTYIIKALENPERGVRDVAIKILGDIGTENEIGTIQKLRMSNDYDTVTVLEAVEKIKKRLSYPLMPTKVKEE
ncbi:MAG: HEAT repeat domain-containing protein [Candidatus Marinimicrobia bacterium]|nr:HEAT repeat domain-containing protein [Candidatus Neomarinimicrobiota bacterium]MBL7046083.1 HEAT repeat domain-containing protein [Candidatus Neomarinimicrobiota bacterium]